MSEQGRAERALARVGAFVDRRWRRDPRPEPRTARQRAAQTRFLYGALALLGLVLVVAAVAKASPETQNALIAVGGLAVLASTVVSTRAALSMARESQSRETRQGLRDFANALVQVSGGIEGQIKLLRQAGQPGQIVGHYYDSLTKALPPIEEAMKIVYRSQPDLPPDLRSEGAEIASLHARAISGLLSVAAVAEPLAPDMTASWASVVAAYADYVPRLGVFDKGLVTSTPATVDELLDVVAGSARLARAHQFHAKAWATLDGLR